MHAENKFLPDLQRPLIRRGRPRSSRQIISGSRRYQPAYAHSNLALLHQQGKITTDQYNAGETFLWILRETRKNLPLPKLSQTKYQEKVSGAFYEINLKNEAFVKEIFQKWYQSIDILKKMGTLTKELLENFIWYNDHKIHQLSPVEIQLIKRGLDALSQIYQS